MDGGSRKGISVTDCKAYRPRFTKPEEVAAWLSRHGWTKQGSVTEGRDASGNRVKRGEGDFEKVCDRVVRMYQTPNMGLLVTGGYGCGKTSLVLALHDYGRRFDMTLPDQVERLDGEGGYRSSFFELFDGSVFIDDLGAESGLISRGSGDRQITVRKPVVCEFICQYYRYGKGRLWITSNLGLNTDEFADRVGGRVFDRLKDLCVPVAMTGASKRKWVL